MIQKKQLVVTIMGISLCLGSQLHAQTSDSLIELMQLKGMITESEATKLKQSSNTEITEAIDKVNKLKVGSWIEKMKWAGDLRLRLEYFDNEDQTNQADRWRFRYRLRLGVTSTFIEWATVGVRLASGSTSDPLSTNETMDDGFANDPITIDHAYATIHPPNLSWLKITAGKMNNVIWQPGFNSPLEYDGDITPEGLAQQIIIPFGEERQNALFVNAHQLVFNESGSSANSDGYLYEFQTGANIKLGGNAKEPTAKATLAGGYLFTDNADTGGLLSDTGNSGNAIGSISGTTTNFLSDFKIVYVSSELDVNLRDEAFLGTPCKLRLGAQYIHNLASEFETLAGSPTTGDPDQTDGYSFLIAFGNNKKKGDWLVAYQYKYLEADAIWDALTDSDWGTGGTDRKGHVIRGVYNFQDWWQFVCTASITEKISNRGGLNSISAVSGEELLRVQIDTILKF